MSNGETLTDAFQDHYSEDLSYCYGCGSANAAGHQIKSRWDGDETVAYYDPRPEHTAIPGFVYGGLIASLIDCHGTGSASAAAYRAAGRELGSDPKLRFVTGSLQVNYLKPTPMGVTLEVHGRIAEVKGRKVVVDESVYADGVEVATGRVVAIQMPDSMAPPA